MSAFPSSEPDAHHDFAYSIALGKNIHISEAPERGRKGYTCIGCSREMQAVFPKKQQRRKFFRHDAQFIKPGEHCTFKDEEYRQTLAITTLELNKEIRVPPVYKYPPKGEAGLALFLLPGQIVSASRVEKHKYFYETDTGNIASSHVYAGPDELLLFKADVVFYDENDEPVLFIQLGKRKKLTVQERAGLQRLRVNTINLTVPKDSAAAIEISQKKGDRAKWIYHDDEQQISYFSVPDDLGEGIPVVDGDPDRLSEETYDCRKVQVNNLIRALSQCLESEPYRIAERGVSAAIGKAELSIKRAGERREELEDQYWTAAEAANQEQLDDIERRRSRLKSEREGLSQRYRNLEERYQSKKRELTQEAQLLETDIRAEEITLGGTGKPVEQLRTDLDRKHERARSSMDEEFGRAIESIEREQREVERAIAIAGAAIERLQQHIGGASTDLSRKRQSQRNFFDQLEEAEKDIIRGLEKERDGRPGRIAAAGTALKQRFEELRRLTALAAENEDTQGPTNLSSRIRILIETRAYILAIESGKAGNRGLRQAKDFIGTPAFETWISQYQH